MGKGTWPADSGLAVADSDGDSLLLAFLCFFDCWAKSAGAINNVSNPKKITRPARPLRNGSMGSVYSRHVLGYPKPSVGLISLGEEDVKGNELTKEVFKMLRASSLNFRGNIEGRHLFENPVEVVVTDGFVGNVILKTSESIAVAIFTWLKHELQKNAKRAVGAALSKEAFRTIHRKTNYEEYGGSPLLGVNGICIIAHGASTPLAIKNALRVAVESVEHQVNPHIIGEVQRYHETAAPLEPAIH